MTHIDRETRTTVTVKTDGDRERDGEINRSIDREREGEINRSIDRERD